MIWRSIENFTASALRGVPSWKLTPLRSLNVYFRPSLLIAHDSARPGTICVLSSGNVTSVSTTRRPTRLELRSVTCAGSRFTGSATSPTTSVLTGWAAPGAAMRPASAATSHAITRSFVIATRSRRAAPGNTTSTPGGSPSALPAPSSVPEDPHKPAPQRAGLDVAGIVAGDPAHGGVHHHQAAGRIDPDRLAAHAEQREDPAL